MNWWSTQRNASRRGEVLRERAEGDQLYHTELPDLPVPPEALLALLGIKEVDEGYGTSDFD